MGTKNDKARYATAHWLRFPGIVTPEQLALTLHPPASLSWKVGPDGPIGPDGYRLPSNIWCGIALYGDYSAAEEALKSKERYLPYLAQTLESWHALLLPIAHRGECNHIERSSAGTIFDVESKDPGGPLFVMTTAGFNPGLELDIARVIDFRVHVDKVRDWLKSVEGRVASQMFTPHTVGDDGVTLSIWRTDAENCTPGSEGGDGDSRSLPLSSGRGATNKSVTLRPVFASRPTPLGRETQTVSHPAFARGRQLPAEFVAVK